MKLELLSYTPTVIETDSPVFPKIVLVAVPVMLCATCSSPMVSVPKQTNMPGAIGIAAQLDRGRVNATSGDVDERRRVICTTCAEAGKAQFICVTCGGIRTSDQVAERFGDPPEFICTLCYATIPAKVYDEALERLQEVHRYDYE